MSDPEGCPSERSNGASASGEVPLREGRRRCARWRGEGRSGQDRRSEGRRREPRRGETTWNAEQRVQGQIDVPLSELGRRQAERLAERLAHEPLAAAYTSDLSRAWGTARIALAGRDLPLIACRELREINLGEWQGLTGAQIRRRWPGKSERFWNADPDAAPAGGETRHELQARVVAAIQAIAVGHPGERVLIVSHGGALRALVCWALNADLSASGRLEVDNCGLSILELRPARPMLVRWNDVAHLEGMVDEAVGRQPFG